MLLFSAFASSLAYLYGAIDTGSQVDRLRRKDKVAEYSYGSTEDLDKACFVRRSRHRRTIVDFL